MPPLFGLNPCTSKRQSIAGNGKRPRKEVKSFAGNGRRPEEDVKSAAGNGKAPAQEGKSIAGKSIAGNGRKSTKVGRNGPGMVKIKFRTKIRA